VKIDFVPYKTLLNMFLILVKVKGVNFNFHLSKKIFISSKSAITMLTAKSYSCFLQKKKSYSC